MTYGECADKYGTIQIFGKYGLSNYVFLAPITKGKNTQYFTYAQGVRCTVRNPDFWDKEIRDHSSTVLLKWDGTPYDYDDPAFDPELYDTPDLREPDYKEDVGRRYSVELCRLMTDEEFNAMLERRRIRFATARN